MGKIRCVTTGWRELLTGLCDDDVVFIAPGAQKAKAVRKDSVDVISNIRVVTPDGLINEIVDSAAPGIRRISRTATEYIVSTILADHQENLTYLRDIHKFPGTAAAVTRFILATINTVPEVVSKGFRHAFDSGDLGARDRDLILVGDEFLRRMRDRRSACTDMLWALGLEALRSGDCARVKALSEQLVIIDGIYSSTELYWQVLAAIVERAKDTYLLGRALSSSLASASTIEDIRVQLYNAQIKELLLDAIAGRAVEVFDTRDAEVRAVARRIAGLLRNDSNLRPRDIAVVTSNPDRYLPIVDEYFTAYNVPFEAVSGFPLRTSPMSSVVRRLLAQTESPGDRTKMFELLASGSVDAGNIDIQLVDRFARRFNVSDLSGLAGVIDSMPVDYFTDADEINRLRQSLVSLDEFMHNLYNLAKQTSPRKFVDILVGLLVDLKVLTNGVLAPWLLADPFNGRDGSVIGEWSRRNASALRSLIDALEDVRDAVLLFDDRGAVSNNELIRIIEDAIDDGRYRCDPLVDAVQVMGFKEVRGAEFKHCFVLGLVEEEFPVPQQCSFLPERRGEWRDRCIEAAHQLLDILYCNENAYFTAFASEDSKMVSVSPVLLGVDRVSASADLTDTENDCADFEIQAAAGFAFYRGDFDTFFDAMKLGRVQSAAEQLRMEVLREAVPVGGPYGGEMPPDMFDLERRVYSVTQLETYIRCPFRYMATYLLGIEPIEEVEDELLSNEMGSLVHQILCKFGTDGGFELIKSDLGAARKLLLEIAQSVFNIAAEGKQLSLFMKVQFERLVDGLDGSSEGYGLLRRFLDYESARNADAKPVEFEKRFECVVPYAGEGSNPARSRQIRIIGSIDRVDLTEDGSVCFVTDYKTGQLPSFARIKDGLSLQLPVYLMAIGDCLSLKPESKLLAAYYHLPASGPVKISSPFGDVDAAAGVLGSESKSRGLSMSAIGGLEALKERIRNICSEMRSGIFTTTRLDPDKAGCRYCEFSRVCRCEFVTEMDALLEVFSGGEL